MAEMAKYEWQIGDVTIVVFAPEGVDVAGASAHVRSADREAFLRAADAVGGLDTLQLPVEDRGYEQVATRWAERPDGTMNSSVRVNLQEPPREESAPATAPPHPFFSPLAARRERERVAADGGPASREAARS